MRRLTSSGTGVVVVVFFFPSHLPKARINLQTQIPNLNMVVNFKFGISTPATLAFHVGLPENRFLAKAE